MFQTQVKEQHENADINATEISKSERRDYAVLSGTSVMVNIQDASALVYDLPRLDIAGCRSKPYNISDPVDNIALPELLCGHALECREITRRSELRIIIDLADGHHYDVFKPFKTPFLRPSDAEPERAYSS